MKKSITSKRSEPNAPLKLLVIMKLGIILIIATCIQSIATVSFSQNTLLSLKMESAGLEKILSEIENQTEISFLYSPRVVNLNRLVSINVTDKSIVDILDELFVDTEIVYLALGKQVVLTSKDLLPNNQTIQVQQTEVTGQVTDVSTGESIPGVNVVIKGTSIGTVTDIDGRYSISIARQDDILIFSYIGYSPQEIQVGNRTNIDIGLLSGLTELSEIVVVGYGTQKRVNLTGSVSHITSESIEKRQVGQASMLLQGAIPGVTVVQRSGQPGADGGQIRIRGIGTLNDPNPLILVDGVEMSLNNIDVGSIESISVLKDASSASIYGSKAANGVILVTTKRAQEGDFSLSYSSYFGMQQPTDLIQKVDAIDHMILLNEAYTNVGRTQLYSDSYINEYKANMQSDPDQYPNTNWQNEILKGNGFQQNHFLTLSGGSEMLRVLGSFGYYDQNGLVPNVGYKRYSLRLNTDLIISEKIKASFDINMYDHKRNSVAQYQSVSGNDSGIGLIFGMMHKLPQNMATRYSNGLWGEGANGENPVAILEEGGFWEETRTPFIGNFSIDYSPLTWLSANIAYAPIFNQPRIKSYVRPVKTHSFDGSSHLFTRPQIAELHETASKDRRNLIKGTIIIDKNLNKHNFKMLFGSQYESSYFESINSFRDDFTFLEYPFLAAGSQVNMRTTGTATEWALLSYFSRLNYDFEGRYLFEANLRYDGSSRFAEGNRWGMFPSFSAGWRISEESFLINQRHWLDNLMIRASWGVLGNQNIGSNYPFASTVNLGTNYISDDKIMDGAAITELANTLITWESTEMYNIGIDLGFYSKLFFAFDYYNRITNDILLRLDIPTTMGVTAPFQNAGVVENKGWDLNLNYYDNIGDFNYNIGFMLSDVKNKILDLKGIQTIGVMVNHEGFPINSLYLLEADGMISDHDYDAENQYLHARQFGTFSRGDIKYINNNDDDFISDDDRSVMGSTIPRYTYSMNLNAGFKGFDFHILLQGVGKVDGYLSSYAVQPFHVGSSAYEIHKNRWSESNPNPDAMFPRFTFGEPNNNQPSTFWMKSAAYLRIKNIQLGYALPANIIRNIGLNRARIYVSGQNLYTFHNFWEGWDVEISPNSNGFYYPQVKTYNVGIEINL